MGFGGGWTFGVIPFIRSTSTWLIWENQTPWAISAIVTHLLKFSPALLILSYLLLSGKKRKDFFLTKGKIDAQVEPTKLLGMKKPEPWTRTGTLFALIFGLSTLVYLALTNTPSWNALALVAPLVPVAVFIALINAFNEEFTLRAAPLSMLWSNLGKQQALMITSVFWAWSLLWSPQRSFGCALVRFSWMVFRQEYA